MIARYTIKEMGDHWDLSNRYEYWLKVELASLQVLEKHKVVPAKTHAAIKRKAHIVPERISEIEEKVKHDVIAFTTSIAEQVGEHSRYFHYGLTSSDVVDTALAMQIRDALIMIYKELSLLLAALKKKAQAHKKDICIGRTHGMHAEPMSFGAKFLSYYAELSRGQRELAAAIESISFGKVSGAVGSYGVIAPETEAEILKNLGLSAEPISTQIIPRDRHAKVMNVLAVIASSMERLSVELRHLQRSEVGEVEEAFSQGQKGSSAMPHKKNPISAENLSGCARVLRGYSLTALENIVLWHERDISHSSAERIILPDATILVHYMLRRATQLIDGLVVKKDIVKKNLDQSQGVFFSGHVLLALVKKGVSREDAYVVVQKAAHQALKEEKPLLKLLRAHPLVREKLTEKELSSVMDLRKFIKHVDKSYRRVFSGKEKRSF